MSIDIDGIITIMTDSLDVEQAMALADRLDVSYLTDGRHSLLYGHRSISTSGGML